MTKLQFCWQRISQKSHGAVFLVLKKKNQTSNLKLPHDSVFTVESVLNAKNEKGVLYYLVKFAGFPANQACWEPCTNLPRFIVEHYKEKSNHGKPLPAPTIKYTQRVDDNSEIYHFLEWKHNDHGGKELDLENGETLFDLDLDKLATDEKIGRAHV